MSVDHRCRGRECGFYDSGHLIHFIHAKRLGQHPWGWRDAVVTGVDGFWVSLAYLDSLATPRVWHHRRLSRFLTVGAPVRLHEQYYALGCPDGWFSVVVEDGLGPVPRPADTSPWDDGVGGGVSGGVVDLSTGVAIALDHESERDRERDEGR
ncbi:hypothetical protein [Nocardioides sp. GY 10127]|uniref:hypothetical protein n=1 Tax=Nocardioides sp. GY 10127 TaxID=2569762 RepID=UPI0010A7DA15|nr:hypothetical protein [Nocardioides sp. GY 10127]TIC82583.1 hypothetical protein E8D37_07645 [Nocardioides sp. GY 10127]